MPQCHQRDRRTRERERQGEGGASEPQLHHTPPAVAAAATAAAVVARSIAAAAADIFDECYASSYGRTESDYYGSGIRLHDK